MATSKAMEVLLTYGASGFSDADLLALATKMPVHKAQALLDAGGLAHLMRMEANELREAGMREAAAQVFVAMAALTRRAAASELRHAPQILGPDSVAVYMRAVYGDEPQEVFVALGFDARQRLRSVRETARGSLSHVDVHPREVFRPMIRAGVHSLVVAHNHPSGEPEPSGADVELTRRLAEVGRLVGIPVLDHVIVTRTRSVSLASLGIVPGLG